MNSPDLDADKGLLDSKDQVNPGNIGKDHHRDRDSNRHHHHIDQNTQTEIQGTMHRIGGFAVFGRFGPHQIGVHQCAAIAAQQPVTGQECQTHHQVFQNEARQRHIAQRHQNRHQNGDGLQTPATAPFKFGPEFMPVLFVMHPEDAKRRHKQQDRNDQNVGNALDKRNIKRRAKGCRALQQHHVPGKNQCHHQRRNPYNPGTARRGSGPAQGRRKW